MCIDESLSIPTATAIEFIDGPGGIPPAVEPTGSRLYEIGRYDFRLTDAEGTRSDLRLVCFELPLLAHIERQCRSLGYGGDAVDARRVRRVVRALAQTDWFTGRISDVTTDDPTRALRHFGAA
jgi:hypothetical protein